MSTIGKSIVTTISMIVVVLSLAVVSPTTARGNGNKRTRNPARSQQSHNMKARSVSPHSTSIVTTNPKWHLPVTMMDYMGSPVVTYSRRRR